MKINLLHLYGRRSRPGVRPPTDFCTIPDVMRYVGNNERIFVRRQSGMTSSSASRLRVSVSSAEKRLTSFR
jgi:hypothetical protein